MSTWQTSALLIPRGHPTAAGHFPGHPVIPGALLLDELVRILDVTGAIRFQAVKFIAPIQPGTPLELRWQHRDTGLHSFAIHPADGPAAVTGTFSAAP